MPFVDPTEARDGGLINEKNRMTLARGLTGKAVCLFGSLPLRLPRLRVRTPVIAVRVVALLVWAAIMGTQSCDYFRREGMRRTGGRLAGDRRQGILVGAIRFAVRRILRTVGPEVSPSDVAPLDARRPRSSRTRV